MRGYKVVAKFGKDTIKFELPLGVPQETLKEAHQSARKLGAKAFGLALPLLHDETLAITMTEYYED